MLFCHKTAMSLLPWSLLILWLIGTSKHDDMPLIRATVSHTHAHMHAHVCFRLWRRIPLFLFWDDIFYLLTIFNWIFSLRQLVKTDPQLNVLYIVFNCHFSYLVSNIAILGEFKRSVWFWFFFHSHKCYVDCQLTRFWNILSPFMLVQHQSALNFLGCAK